MGGIYIKGLPMPRGEDEGFLIAIFDGFAQKVGTREEFVAYEVVSEMEKTTRWIPVTERLPENAEVYLCRIKSFGGEFRYTDTMKYVDGFFYEKGVATERVTHWMPLPEPPKEEQI